MQDAILAQKYIYAWPFILQDLTKTTSLLGLVTNGATTQCASIKYECVLSSPSMDKSKGKKTLIPPSSNSLTQNLPLLRCGLQNYFLR